MRPKSLIGPIHNWAASSGNRTSARPVSSSQPSVSTIPLRGVEAEQVVQELLADPDSQWHEYRGRGPITKNQVAALLKDFEIRPVVVHPTKRADVSRHGYRAALFEDVFARFLPPEPNIRTLKRGGGEKT
jgi:Protein of unknown function (DUF3631)